MKGENGMVTRSFLSVGQGAFYCEQFKMDISNEKINIIYDCGSDNMEMVHEQIRNNFEKGEIIHAVFISHLDNDHINGLPYLLKYCKVKKIFFPLIKRKNIYYISLFDLLKNGESNTFLSDFLENPYRAIGKIDLDYSPEFFQIGEGREEEFNGIDARSIPSGVDISSFIMEKFKNTLYICNKWTYIPHNFCQEDRIIELQTYLSEMFGKNMDDEDIYHIWKYGDEDEKYKVKQAYKRVKGSFNTNSLTLYSGIKNLDIKQAIADSGNFRCYLRDIFSLKNAGCLYTGDYDASGKEKWKQLYEAYRTYWDTIGCIQLPHHGSRHNYNQELGYLDAYYIISAGMNNKYRHPHSIVIKDLLYKHHFPYIVTEQQSSEVHLIIE